MKRILIAEDDSLLNKTLAYNLTSDGYDITTALNAKIAANRLAGAEYDLVLLDINLPYGNGYDLCKLIVMLIELGKKENENVRVYFCPGSSEEMGHFRKTGKSYVRKTAYRAWQNSAAYG